MTSQPTRRGFLFLVCAITAAGCATVRPPSFVAPSFGANPSTNGPTLNGPGVYPQAANQPTGPAPPASAPAAATPANSRTGPTLTASRLGLRPGELASERALELTGQLTSKEEAIRSMGLRVQELEKTVAEKDQALQNARAEVQATRDLLAQGRADLEKVRGELQSMREKVRQTDRQHIETLEATVNLLQKAMSENKPAASRATREN